MSFIWIMMTSDRPPPEVPADIPFQDPAELDFADEEGQLETTSSCWKPSGLVAASPTQGAVAKPFTGVFRARVDQTVRCLLRLQFVRPQFSFGSFVALKNRKVHAVSLVWIKRSDVCYGSNLSGRSLVLVALLR